MYTQMVNAAALYLIVGAILLFISVMCVVFIIKSYRAGLAIGMDKTILKRTMTSSLTFTLLPSISILLGVITLSMSLGFPISWLRLSVVGSLPYELQVAGAAAEALEIPGGLAGLNTMGDFSTIVLVMTVGIFGGGLTSLFFLRRYLNKLQGKPKEKHAAAEGETLAKPRQSFSAIAIIALFIGLCTAYIGTYVGQFVSTGDWTPLFTVAVAALSMGVFEYFTIKKKMAWLDNFSIATSMLIAMAAAVVVKL